MAPKDIKVKPNPEKSVNGRAVQVDHPFQTGRKINKAGEEIQNCAYLQRRLKDGDLVLCDEKKKKKEEPKSETAHQPKKKEVEK